MDKHLSALLQELQFLCIVRGGVIYLGRKEKS